MIAAVPERRQLTQVLLWECPEAPAQDIVLCVCLCPAVPLRPEQGKPESCVVVGFGSGDSGAGLLRPVDAKRVKNQAEVKRCHKVDYRFKCRTHGAAFLGVPCNCRAAPADLMRYLQRDVAVVSGTAMLLRTEITECCQRLAAGPRPMAFMGLATSHSCPSLRALSPSSRKFSAKCSMVL